MKKLVSLLIVSIMLVSVAACAKQSEPTKLAPVKTVMKIGMIVPTLQYEFFVWLTDGMKKSFEAEGWEFKAMSYDGDANKMISLIENFTVEGVDSIIAMVIDKSADAALKAAMGKGIVVVEAGVLTDAYTIGMVADNKDVGTKIGEMAADYINKSLGGKAQVVSIVSQASPDMADRSNAMEETLKKNAPNATIVGTIKYTNVGDATPAMENYLQQYPDIKVVISFGDSGAIEAIEVVKAAKKTEGFGAFGCDATQQALKLISEGDLMKGTIDMGSLISLMADPTIKYLKGDTTVPKITVGQNVKVTKDNVAKFLK